MVIVLVLSASGQWMQRICSQQPVTTFLNMVSIPFIASSIAKVQQWSAVPTWASYLIRTSMHSLKKVKLPPPFCSIFLRLDYVWGYTKGVAGYIGLVFFKDLRVSTDRLLAYRNIFPYMEITYFSCLHVIFDDPPLSFSTSSNLESITDPARLRIRQSYTVQVLL